MDFNTLFCSLSGDITENIAKAILVLRDVSRYDEVVSSLTKDLCEILDKDSIIDKKIKVKRLDNFWYYPNGIINITHSSKSSHNDVKTTIIGLPWEDQSFEEIDFKESYTKFREINKLVFYQLQLYNKRPIKPLNLYDQSGYFNSNTLSLLDCFKLIEASINLGNGKEIISTMNSLKSDWTNRYGKFSIKNIEKNIDVYQFFHVFSNVYSMFFNYRGLNKLHYQYDSLKTPQLMYLDNTELQYLTKYVRSLRLDENKSIYYNEVLNSFFENKINSMNLTLDISTKDFLYLQKKGYYGHRDLSNESMREYISCIIRFYDSIMGLCSKYPEFNTIMKRLKITEDGYYPNDLVKELNGYIIKDKINNKKAAKESNVIEAEVI